MFKVYQWRSVGLKMVELEVDVIMVLMTYAVVL